MRTLHRAAPLPALVRAVHTRDPEVRRHGCGLQPEETQAGDPVCVGRVPRALHGTYPGGVGRGGGSRSLAWSLSPIPAGWKKAFGLRQSLSLLYMAGVGDRPLVDGC